MCDCYAKIVEEMTAAVGAMPEFDAHSYLVFRGTSGKTGEAWLMRFTYKDGKRNKKSFVTATYCPFCGEKME